MALRNSRYLYVRITQRGAEEEGGAELLFDHLQDPEERIDISHSSHVENVLGDARMYLRALLEETPPAQHASLDYGDWLTLSSNRHSEKIKG